MVVFGQNICIRAKLMYLDKSGVLWQIGCTRAIWLYLVKVVVFILKVVFGRSGVFGQTRL